MPAENKENEGDKPSEQPREGLPEQSHQKLNKLMTTILPREKLYELGCEKLQKMFVKDFATDNIKETISGKLAFHGNTDFEKWVGLKHIIPPEYKYVEVTPPNGEVIKSAERRDNGSFYDAKGQYIPVWEEYSFTAYAEKPVETPPSPAVLTPTETTNESGDKLPEVSSKQTIFVGDSISVGMSQYLEGAELIAKGGKQTAWMLESFLRFIEEKKSGQHPDVKRVVVYGGINDIASLKTPEQIEKNLTKLYQAAHEAGLTVVACTMHKWDTQAFIERYGKRKGISYPLSATELDDRKDELNKWILAQKGGLVDEVVNFQTEMGNVDDKTFKRGGDKLHLSPEGYKQTVQLIRSRANIGMA